MVVLLLGRRPVGMGIHEEPLGRVVAISNGYMLMLLRMTGGLKGVIGQRMILRVVSMGVGMPWWVELWRYKYEIELVSGGNASLVTRDVTFYTVYAPSQHPVPATAPSEGAVSCSPCRYVDSEDDRHSESLRCDLNSHWH